MKPDQGLLCPCVFLVPVAYNDGTEVEPEVIIEISLALNRQFDGYTKLGVREGSWLGQVEQVTAYEVSVPLARVPELKQVVRWIGKRLKQKKMYFHQGQPGVELLDPEDDELKAENE